MEPQISILRREAKEFGANGGNEALFWAGKMSDLVGNMLRSDLRSISETATLLGQVKREYDDRILSSAAPCSRCFELEREIARLREELDWQNVPNRREPVRGGYEFYINEEWTGIRDAALGENCGFQATLMKVRFDPDDERVRIRRVLDDDAILKEIAEIRAIHSANA
jgi:hypothetical protein